MTYYLYFTYDQGITEDYPMTISAIFSNDNINKIFYENSKALNSMRQFEYQEFWIAVLKKIHKHESDFPINPDFDLEEDDGENFIDEEEIVDDEGLELVYEAVRKYNIDIKHLLENGDDFSFHQFSDKYIENLKKKKYLNMETEYF